MGKIIYGGRANESCSHYYDAVLWADAALCLQRLSFTLCFCRYLYMVLINPESEPRNLIAILKPVIKFGDLYRVEIIKVKNHIEVLVGLSSIPLMLMGKVAPIFRVFYWQYLRVKYVTNQFTRHSFLEFDNKILKKVFVGQFYTIIIGNLKIVVFYFINYKQEEGASEQNQEQFNQDDLGIGKKKQSKKLD